MEKMEKIFQDNHLLILDKPFGVACQSKEGFSVETKYPDFHLINRIDQPVAGLVMLAKTKKVAAALTKQLIACKIQKSYEALVEGIVENDEGICIDKIVKKGSKAFVAEQGKLCELHWKVVERYDRYTRLDIQIIQGRFHQIRCQLAHMGHTVKGDLKYGAKRSNKNPGISMVCKSIHFAHPKTQEFVNCASKFEATL